MISIYDFSDYREFLKSWIDSQKGAQKGLQGKMAEAAGVSSSLISFILKGEKHLSLEQAAEISEFVGLTTNENDFFYLLVDYGKAGSTKLRRQLEERIENKRKNLGARIEKKIELSDEVKATYYSNWAYTGIRNLTALPENHDVQSIARRLGIAPTQVASVLDFLLKHGLCKIVDGKISYGVQKTHVPADSVFVQRHHQNWRLRGFQIMEQRKETDLFFTGPMSLSAEVAAEVQRLLPKYIEQIMQRVGPSASEKIYCLNIDWFEY